LAKNVKKILVAGKHADDIGYQCGGWTIAWHGDSGKITPGKYKLRFAKKKLCQLCSLDVIVVAGPNLVPRQLHYFLW
jgi:beta-glucosidase-like glycosyl hydrolase